MSSLDVRNESASFDRQRLGRAVERLAGHGVFVGTSSWKYPGWLGQIYDESRYTFRGRFSGTRFERQCLAEYAEVFPSVCVDAAYYRFPTDSYLAGLVEQVPAHFKFTFKVTDEITIRKFTQLPRFGPRAGKLNANFLNVDMFLSDFLKPCEPFRKHIAVLIFEFSHFYRTDFARARDFLAALDAFLGRLPRGWPYGVEIRNPGFLRPDYFALLARHGVAHVLNSWQGMPPVLDQLAAPGVFSNPEFSAARFLLKPGRDYEDAVDRFSPYERVQEAYPEGRTAGAQIIRRVAAREPEVPRSFYVYVNNRFEGNALQTIEAMLQEAHCLDA